MTALASQAIAISDDPEKFFTGLTRDNFINFSEDDHIDFMREDMQEYLSSVAPDDFGYLLSLMMSLKPMKIFDLLFTPKAMITWIDDKVNSKPAPSVGTIGSPPADSRPRLYGNGEFHSRRELFRHLVEVKSWEQVGARDKNDGGRRTICSFMRLAFRFSNRTDHTTFLSPARPEDYGQHITEADAIPADISKYVHRSHWITTRKHLVQFVIVSSLPLGKLCYWKYNFMGTTGVQFRKDLNNDNLDVEVLHSYPWESQAAYAICGGQALLGAGNVAREFSLRMSTEGRHDIGTSISAIHGHAQSPYTGLVKSRVWLIMAPADMIEGLWDKIEIFYPLEGASQSACPMIGSCYIVALRPSSSLPAAEIEAALRFNNKTYSDNSIIMARGLPLQLDPHHTIYGGEPPADGPPSSAVTVAQALLFNETSPPCYATAGLPFERKLLRCGVLLNGYAWFECRTSDSDAVVKLLNSKGWRTLLKNAWPNTWDYGLWIAEKCVGDRKGITPVQALEMAGVKPSEYNQMPDFATPRSGTVVTSSTASTLTTASSGSQISKLFREFFRMVLKNPVARNELWDTSGRSCGDPYEQGSLKSPPELLEPAASKPRTPSSPSASSATDRGKDVFDVERMKEDGSLDPMEGQEIIDLSSGDESAGRFSLNSMEHRAES